MHDDAALLMKSAYGAIPKTQQGKGSDPDPGNP